MIRFNQVKRALAPLVAGSALAVALLAGIAQAAPASADPPPGDPHATASPSEALYPPGPTAAPPVADGVIIHDVVGRAAARDGVIVND